MGPLLEPTEESMNAALVEYFTWHDLPAAEERRRCERASTRRDAGVIW